jgi:hypothetical protein
VRRARSGGRRAGGEAIVPLFLEHLAKAIDELPHEGHVDFALRISKDPANDFEGSSRNTKGVDHYEGGRAARRLLVKRIQDADQSFIKLSVYDLYTASRRQFRTALRYEAFEMLIPLPVALDEQEGKVCTNLSPMTMLDEGIQSDQR